MAGQHARDDRMTVSFAVDADGAHPRRPRPSSSRTSARSRPPGAAPSASSGMLFPGPYKIPKIGFSATAVYTNTCGRCSYRGPWMMETVVREQMIDVVARGSASTRSSCAGATSSTTADLPYTTAAGHGLRPTCRSRASLEQAVDDDRLRRAARRAGARAGARAGCSASASGCTSSRPASPWAACRARRPIVSVGVNGQVQALMSSGSHGQSLETTIAQVVADRARRRRRRRHRRPGRHRVGAVRPGHRRQPQRGDPAAAPPTSAAERVRAQAARDRRPPPRGGARGPRDRGRPDLGGRHAGQGDDDRRAGPASPTSTRPALPPGMEMGLEAKARYTPNAPFTWSNSCHACMCEVDRGPARVTLLRYVVSEDCGVMINPTSSRARSPAASCRASAACSYEHMVYDDAGNPLTHDVPRLPAADRGRGADDRVRPHRDAGDHQPRRATRGWARAARSARRRPSSTPSPTPSPTSARGSTRQPLTPMAVLAALDRRRRTTHRRRSAERNRQLLLRERPTGAGRREHFELVETPVPEPGDGEVLLRTRWLSFDPAQRGWLNDVRSYVPPVAIGAPMRAYGIGEVVTSNADGVEAGRSRPRRRSAGRTTSSSTRRPRRTFEPVPADVDAAGDDARAARACTGLTAYFGMTDIGRPRRGRRRARHRGRRRDRFDRRPDRQHQGRRPGHRHGRRAREAGLGARRRRLRRLPRPLRRGHPAPDPGRQPRRLPGRVRQRRRRRCSTPRCSTSPTAHGSCCAARSPPATSRSARTSGCTTTSC